jgi:hypothetical protein
MGKMLTPVLPPIAHNLKSASVNPSCFRVPTC